MSIIGEALEKKISNPDIKDKTYYIDNIHCESILGLKTNDYTFMELKSKINFFKKYIEDNYKDKKTCFLIVDNSIEDIAFFIALMESNIKPIIIHKDKLIELYLSNTDIKYMEFDPNLTNIHMPFERDHKENPDYSKESSFVSSINIRSNCYLSHVPDEIRLDSDMINRLLNYYLKKNDLKDVINEDDYDFGLLTSGTTSNFKIQKVKEKDLYNKIINNYDLDTIETIINTTAISSISGLLFNLYIPMLSNKYKRALVSNSFYSVFTKENGLVSIVVPGGKNLFNDSILNDYTVSLNHIYFIGKKLTMENIENIRSHISNLPDDCIYNFYGNTENLGLICKCGQKNLKPIYLYGNDIRNDRIVYSPDQKDVYVRMFDGQKIITKKLLMKYNKDLFIPILPISDHLDSERNISVDSGIFGEIKVNGEQTKDYGFAIDNLLYLVGRNNEFIQKDNRYILLSSFENAIKEKTKIECVIARNEAMTNLYLIGKTGEFDDKYKDNYAVELANINKIRKLFEKHNIPIDNYVIIDEDDLPTGVALDKIRKDFLLQYVFPKLDKNKFSNDYKKVLLDVFNKQLSSLFGRIVNVERNEDGYIFDNKVFSFIDYLNIISNYEVYRIESLKGKTKFCITDSFISAKHPNTIKKPVNIYNKFRELFDDDESLIHVKISIEPNFFNRVEVMLTKESNDESTRKVSLGDLLKTEYNTFKISVEDPMNLKELDDKDRINNNRNVFFFDAYLHNDIIYLQEDSNELYQGIGKTIVLKK